MNKTESLASSIYKDVFSLLDHYNSTLQSTEESNDIFTFAKKVFNESNETEKKLFLGFIKVILSDSASMVLGGLDGSGGNILNTCDELEIFCDGQKIDPWVNDFFLEMVEKSYI